MILVVAKADFANVVGYFAVVVAMLVEWLEFHWMISEVARRLKEVVQVEELGEQQANLVFLYLAVKDVWQPRRPIDFATDFGNLLPKPSVALTTVIKYLVNYNFSFLSEFHLPD